MKKYILGLCLLISVAPSLLFAYTAIGGQDDLRIDTPTNDNLYAAGGRVTINNDIGGDGIVMGGDMRISGNIGDNALIAGGTITISGTIGGDLFVAGEDIQLQGRVTGDIRAVGGRIALTNSASGDVNLAGGEVRVMSGVRVGRDLSIAGSTIVMNGSIAGKSDITAEILNIDGTIAGDASISINDVKNLHIGPNANIIGKLTYKSQSPIPNLEKIAAQGATYAGVPDITTTPPVNTATLAGIATGYVLYRFLFLLIVGGLLLMLCRRTIRQTAIILQQHPGKSFLYGLLYYILMPIMTILLFITVIGIPLGFLSIAFYIFSFVFAKLVTLVIFSELISNIWSTTLTQSWQRWGIFALLALLLAIVSGVDAIAVLFAVGAIVIAVGQSLSGVKKNN